jgi:hypothetical protein
MMVNVFDAMITLITAKGSTKKMVSIYDIHQELRVQGVIISKMEIDSCLDKFIQMKDVCYYVNDKEYIYFGVTKQGWAKHEQGLAKREVASQQRRPYRRYA